MGELIPETTGPAMWGQDGVYSARDDRLAVTALAMGRTGVVREAEFTPEPGTPDITVAAGWMAVADSGDGSLMVVAGAEPGAVQVLPGGETPRVDVIWADVFPEQGRWVLAVLRQEDTEDRTGIALGTVDVPALAETADEMTVNPAPPNFNTFGEVGPAGPAGPQGPPGPRGLQGEQGPPGPGLLSSYGGASADATGTGMVAMSLMKPMAPFGPDVSTITEIDAWGEFYPMGSALQWLITMGGGSEAAVTPTLGAAFLPNGYWYRWHAKATVVYRPAPEWPLFFLVVQVSHNVNVSSGVNANSGNLISNPAQAAVNNYSPPRIAARWAASSAGQIVRANYSTCRQYAVATD